MTSDEHARRDPHQQGKLIRYLGYGVLIAACSLFPAIGFGVLSQEVVWAVPLLLLIASVLFLWGMEIGRLDYV